MRNLALFTVAATLEISGCFAFWAWLRLVEDRAPSATDLIGAIIAVIGATVIVVFAAKDS